jgi:hypothetical protein
MSINFSVISEFQFSLLRWIIVPYKSVDNFQRFLIPTHLWKTNYINMLITTLVKKNCYEQNNKCFSCRFTLKHSGAILKFEFGGGWMPLFSALAKLLAGRLHFFGWVPPLSSIYSVPRLLPVAIVHICEYSNRLLLYRRNIWIFITSQRRNT